MKSILHRFAVAGAVLLACMQAATAHASTFLAMSLDELVAASDRVILGEVVQTEAFWDSEGRVILTDASIRVRERILGESDRDITVRTFGGTVDDYTVLAHGFPVFEAGDRVLLFLEDHADGTTRVTGYQLGHYKIVMRGGTPYVSPTYDGGNTLLDRRTGRPIPGPFVQDLDTFRAELRSSSSRR